ncbi:MAG TPA: hypothetical protein VGM98_01975 [Schlesneria sp.]|jgi:hypothetical protein
MSFTKAGWKAIVSRRADDGASGPRFLEWANSVDDGQLGAILAEPQAPEWSRFVFGLAAEYETPESD